MKPLQRNDNHELVRRGKFHEHWENDVYSVLVRRDIKPGDPYGPGAHVAWPPMDWLSIKRHDRLAITRDWRNLQEIKNDVCGEEAEGVELYPAESRKMDEANQFHLWVVRPPHKWPFGSPVRTVSGHEEAKKLGAKQRPFKRSDRYRSKDAEPGDPK